MSRRTLIVAGCLITPLLMGQSCVPLPTRPGILDGLEEFLDSADPIIIFDGEWISLQHGFAYEVNNRIGIVTRANSSARRVGEVMLVILDVTPTGFTGRQVFSNGSINDVQGRLVGAHTLNMSGGGLVWTVTRIRPPAPELTVTVQGQGTVEPGTGTFSLDEEIDVVAIPADGWRFDRWEGTINAGRFDHWFDRTLPVANPATLLMDGHKALTAVFVQKNTATETFDLGDGVTLRIIEIPGGTFTMGSSQAERDAFAAGGGVSFENERPQRTVTVSTFAIGETEVTQAQFEAVMGYVATVPDNCVSDCFNAALDPDRAVGWLNWFEAAEFARALGEATGRYCRLPTEAEWEYACRAGTDTAFSFGDTADDIDDFAWLRSNSGWQANNDAREVAGKEPNAWGLYDMHGNVWEWVGDWISAYTVEPVVDPTGLSQGQLLGPRKILRGGAYNRDPWALRSAYRLNPHGPDSRQFNLGVRVVCE